MDALRTMKLRTKLLTGFLFITVFTLVIGIVGNNKIGTISSADTVLYETVTAPLATISDLSVTFQRTRVNLAIIVGMTDKAEQKKMRDENIEFRAKNAKLLTSYEKTLQTEEERKFFAEMTRVRSKFSMASDQVVALVDAGKREEASNLLQGETRELATDYRKLIDKLVEAKVAQGEQLSRKNRKLAEDATLLMNVLMGFGFMASIGLGLIITTNVLGQLGEDPGYLHEVANVIAGGDLDVTFRAQKKEGGVYAVMQGMVNTMKAKIAEAELKTSEASAEAQRAVVATDAANQAKAQAERAKAEGMLDAANQLDGVVEVVTSASEELSAQVEQSSRGSEEQSYRVAETATAMEEMNATVLEVAKSASNAAETADKAKSKAEEGASIVGQVVKGIDEVRTQAQEMMADMGSLGKQAEGIGNIMNVISDIADQTNLLALNAAIEAARAGEAGRGFAVVADEVRKLAEKTMAATKEVGEAIRGIQDGTKKNIGNVERSGKTIENATVLAGKSGDALLEIVHLVESASDQVRSIATASEEQSSASEEINRSIEDVSRISSETSDAMRQSAQAVGELANQAQILRSLIDRMKAEGGGNGRLRQENALTGRPKPHVAASGRTALPSRR